MGSKEDRGVCDIELGKTHIRGDKLSPCGEPKTTSSIFPNTKNVSSLWRQLSLTHFKTLIYIKDDLRRDFHTLMCSVEKWSVRVLRKKVDSMLFERTAISRTSISKLIDIDKFVFALFDDLFAVFYKAVMIVLDNQPFND